MGVSRIPQEWLSSKLQMDIQAEFGTNGLYKARLVAKGYSQLPGIDYEETFAPVVRFESIRAVIALSTQQNLKLHQIDVTNAILNR